MKSRNLLTLVLILVVSFTGAGYSMAAKGQFDFGGFFNKDEKPIREKSQSLVIDDRTKTTNTQNFEQNGFSDLGDELMPSVVSIIAVKKSNDAVRNTGAAMVDKDLRDFLDRFFSPFGESQNNPREESKQPAAREMTFGSGFVISTDGYVVTNNHVIEDAEEINIKFYDDTQLKAKVIGKDELTDLALLKVTSKKELNFANFGDSDLMKIGNWAIAIGNPFGLGASMSVGIISAIARDINAGPYDNFIQTDASINRGHSGGPLFNINGSVIGINTAIISPSGGNVGIGFAIPSNLALPILDNLKNGKKNKRGYLGVKVQAMSQEMAEALNLNEPYGALVVDVMKDSPGEKAGLKIGDLILEFDGKVIRNMRQLPRLVSITPIDSIVPIKILSQGHAKILKIKILENIEVDEKKTKSIKKNGDDREKYNTKSFIFGDLKIAVADLNEELTAKLALKDINEGVVIIDIDNKKKNSILENFGLNKFDIILQVNQADIKNTEDFEEQLKIAKDKKSLLFLIYRGGVKIFVSISFSRGE